MISNFLVLGILLCSFSLLIDKKYCELNLLNIKSRFPFDLVLASVLT